MPDMMAIISKAVFDKDFPKTQPGAVLPIDVYRSTQKVFEKVGSDRLFLVTVRPNDTLWLVAVLEGLSFDGKQWNATKNTTPVTDVTGHKDSLKFESGKGITAAKGQLGMSLQTPRVLTAADATLLSGKAPAPATPARPKERNLTAHEPTTTLPCLCNRCIGTAPETAQAKDLSFFRMSAEAEGRVLYFWVPLELREKKGDLQQSVAGAMRAKLRRA